MPSIHDLIGLAFNCSGSEKGDVMPNTRDGFSADTVAAICKRAAFICSNPDCRCVTLAPSAADPEKFIYSGIASHITAASPGGPRYDQGMTKEERSSVSNGIFLCGTCSITIDKNNGIDFPTAVLRDWKKRHESWIGANLNKKANGNPTGSVINVTSIGQQGGITAGIVNMERQPRFVLDSVWTQLKGVFTDTSRTITVQAILGDGEAFNFATQIMNGLRDRGYKVEGVDQCVFSAPIPPQSANPDEYKVIIGHQQ